MINSKKRTQQLQYFLFSQYLADGIRITVEIVLPVFICAQFGSLEIGFLVSTGALCVSICDGPSPVENKRKSMLYGTMVVSVMSILTGFASGHALPLGLLIVSAAFIFSMFSVYGNLATAIGTAGLLVMILRMDLLLPPELVVAESVLILFGGIWYMLIALFFYHFAPFRPAQRTLGECIHETARYLFTKSTLYDPATSLEEQYRLLIAQQVIVNEKQDAVRDLLFNVTELPDDPGKTGHMLVLIFSELMDLYEQIMATWYNYSVLRERFGGTGILETISAMITRLAGELDRLGLAIQSNTTFRREIDIRKDLEELRTVINSLPEDGLNKIILRKILVNFRALTDHFESIQKYYRKEDLGKKKLHADLKRFVTPQQYDLQLLKDNFRKDSAIFRHAIRMTITCAAGFIISKSISTGHHSYWILLTIIVILKPGFSFTKQRNIERIIGTIGGGLAGVALLYFITDKAALFVLIVLFMIGTYTFQRLNYIVMVIFTTPYVLLLFQLLGMGSFELVQERLLDTLIASALAFAASYLLFPQWESGKVAGYMLEVLKANLNYLIQLHALIAGKNIPLLEYKLARKDLFVHMANLSAAFRRMLSEPKTTQRHKKEIFEFVILNNVLSSNIASVADSLRRENAEIFNEDSLQTIQRAIAMLEGSVRLLTPAHLEKSRIRMEVKVPGKPDVNLQEQLEFIQKVSADISKVTRVIAA
ncbi:MAG TPA: FUSC family membrane protein [Flavitalea sp.]|nr:FUSC family membrane protein [Flavitalea sp.]